MKEIKKKNRLLCNNHNNGMQNNNIFLLCCITTGLFKDNVILAQWIELKINLNALCVH